MQNTAIGQDDPNLRRAMRLYGLVDSQARQALAVLAQVLPGQRPPLRPVLMIWAVPVACAATVFRRLELLGAPQIKTFIFDQANLVAFERAGAAAPPAQEIDPAAEFRMLVDHVSPYIGRALDQGTGTNYIKSAAQDFLRSSGYHADSYYGRHETLTKAKIGTILADLYAESLRATLNAASEELGD